MVMTSDELSPIKTGCLETPCKNSYYCEKHRSSEFSLFFNIKGERISIKIDSILPIKVHSSSVIQIHDVYCADEESEEYIPRTALFLVQLKSNKVAWVNRGSVTKYHLDMYRNEMIQKEINSVQKKQVAAEILCDTNKEERFPCYSKTKTRGIMLATFNCGIITGYRELFGSESISQVVLFYLDLISWSSKLPQFFIYDDACHLKQYINNKTNNNTKKFKKFTERTNILCEKTHVIDKMHILNHKAEWCLKNCNPYLIDDLNEINTVSCEQTNFWAGKFKHCTKHLNYARFSFFLYIIFEEYNNQKLKRKFI